MALQFQPNLNVTYTGHTITTRSVKYLGDTIDKKLNLSQGKG